MKSLLRVLALSAAVSVPVAGSAQAATGLTAADVAKATFTPLPDPPSKDMSPVVTRAEVLLDRARFSPGSIDGIDGENFRKALGAYQKTHSLEPSGKLDQATWDKLATDTAPPLTSYKLTAADEKGPFTRTIPAKFEAQSRLRRLGYRNSEEMLAERFHMSVGLLRALNPGVSFKKVGQAITVANDLVDHGPVKAARVVVDKADHLVEAFGPDNGLLAVYPASIGSTEKPAPSGDYEIRRVVHNPGYTYDPAYHFKGVESRQPFTIAPGPNNPVGAVWMDLSFEGYGIHGTPDPDAIGKTQSHGCIRLTNWDALDLASLVDKGTPVSFQDSP